MPTTKTTTAKKNSPKAGTPVRAASVGMETKVYSKDGKETGTIDLPETVFGLPWNADLVHQVIVALQGNIRRPIAHTKFRGEVRGGGKKPWRQKGTGRSRHGSTRSPIWKGGGVTFGPRNDRDYERKVNKKMKQRALGTILSAKLRDGELIFIDSLGMTGPKTKDAFVFLKNVANGLGYKELAYKKGKRALIATPEKDMAAMKSFRNIGSAHVEEIRNLDPLSLMTYKYLVIAAPKESAKILEGRIAKAKSTVKKFTKKVRDTSAK